MMLTLAEGPMRLIVGDVPVVDRATGPMWDAWALWLGVLVLIVAMMAVIRRWAARRRDPYEVLLETVCRSAGLTHAERMRLVMRAGGDARDALGRLMLRALRNDAREVPPDSGAAQVNAHVSR